MTVLLPKQSHSVTEAVASRDEEQWTRNSGEALQEVDLCLPKFKLE